MVVLDELQMLVQDRGMPDLSYRSPCPNLSECSKQQTAMWWEIHLVEVAGAVRV